MPEIFTPRGGQRPVFNPEYIPEGLHGKEGILGVITTADEASQVDKILGGPDARPRGMLIIQVPNYRDEQDRPVIIAIVCDDAAPAEIRDNVVEAWGKAEKRRDSGLGLVDFDEKRERFGLVPRSEFDANIKNALADRIAKHKANPISDPARQPLLPDTGRKSFRIETPFEGETSDDD
jgi:hypothetical protein